MRIIVAVLALIAAAGIATNAKAQTYQYNGRVDYGAQSYKQKSFFKSGNGARKRESSFASGHTVKPNAFGGYVPLKSYGQRSFLPQGAVSVSEDADAAPSAAAKSTPPKKEEPRRLTKKDFKAPKTDGGKSPFDRYEIAVPPRPQIKN